MTASPKRLRPVLRYAGYCYDEVSGLYYLSQRYYDPASACFLSKDPARADGEESAYQYCAGDPVGSVDPTGERTQVSGLVNYSQGHKPDCFYVALRAIIRQTTKGRTSPSPATLRKQGFKNHLAGMWGWNKRKLRDLYGIDSRSQSYRVGWGVITSEIRGNHPVMQTGFATDGNGKNGGGHAWVVAGYRYVKKKPQLQVSTWGRRVWVDYASLRSSKGATVNSANRLKWGRISGTWYRFRKK